MSSGRSGSSTKFTESLRDIPAASFLALPPLLVFATHPWHAVMTPEDEGPNWLSVLRNDNDEIPAIFAESVVAEWREG
jgi:hypothetical protein